MNVDVQSEVLQFIVEVYLTREQYDRNFFCELIFVCNICTGEHVFVTPSLERVTVADI